MKDFLKLSKKEQEALLKGDPHGIYIHLERTLQAICNPDLTNKLDRLADDFDGIFQDEKKSINERVLEFSDLLVDLIEN